MRPHILKDIILRSKYGYRFYLSAIRGLKTPPRPPVAPWHNAVLKNKEELKRAERQAKELTLPSHAKIWDDLAILDYILKNVDKKGRILDAGSSIRSQILVSLFLYGYEDLTGIGLEFEEDLRRGPLRYERGDITATRFSDGTFDAVICQSVIEHGANLPEFFAEAARILKKGGALIVSTDYYKEPIDTAGRMAFGLPWKIFSEKDVRNIFALAGSHGLELTGPIDLECEERPVQWMGLSYTFLIFTMRKR